MSADLSRCGLLNFKREIISCLPLRFSNFLISFSSVSVDRNWDLYTSNFDPQGLFFTYIPMVKIKGSSSASGSKMSLQVLMICKVFLANGGWAQIFEPEKFEKKKKKLACDTIQKMVL